MHVYIAPEPSNSVVRRCTMLLFLTLICFNPAPTSTPNGASAIKGAKTLIKHIAIMSCQVLILWMSEPVVT